MTQPIWHSISREEAVKILNTHQDNGLSREEALRRQIKFGKNLLPEEKVAATVEIFLGQFKSPLIYILIIAGFISILLGAVTDASVILAAVFLNVLFGFFQENKASKTLGTLKKAVRIKARVVREGHETEIESRDLVPGDVIILTPGNKVPADGRLMESRNLKIQEAVLTGEWLPALKTSSVLPAHRPLADRDNMVYMGCIVEDGKGKAVVTATALETEMGKIATLVKEVKKEKTPIQNKLAYLSRILGLAILFIVTGIFLGGVLSQKPLFEMFLTAIAVAVAAIPEGLPVSLTVILALGMQRILKKQGLVRNLASAETLGSVSVACTDKTLTLTQGNMTITESFTWTNRIASNNKEWSEAFLEKSDKDQMFLMTIANICSEAFIENPKDNPASWRVKGDPTDKVLIKTGARLGIRKPDLDRQYLKVDEAPFDPQNKFIAALRRRENDVILFVSGAPEKILMLSSLAEIEGGPKTLNGDADRKKLEKELEILLNQGLRTIGVGYKVLGSEIPEYKELKELCHDLIFVGFIGLNDPLRKDAKEVIAACKLAGVKPVLVTGDHLLTARAVAEQIGLRTGKENILLGENLDEMSETEFQKIVENIDVYARVEPQHKLKIVSAWQKQGKVVAMTGDGINDAPALQKADIGVALGSGTDAAKEASDLVLLNDNFGTITTAIEQGRVIIDNIRKVITYLLSDSFTETILVGASVVLGLPLPITAPQILWTNLIEDGLPSMALSFEPGEADVMKRKPIAKNAPLLNREMKAIIFVIGILTDLILVSLFIWLLKNHYYLRYVRTMIFVALGLDSLFYIFCCKNLRKNIWQINLLSNPFLVFSVISGLMALGAGVYLPVFQNLLKTVPLSIRDWGIIAGLGALNILLIEATKWYFIIIRPSRHHP